MTKLVVYAICKDEIKNVDAWYDSMKEADEVIVLDTGSTDGTPERLEELGATVYRDYPVSGSTGGRFTAPGYAVAKAGAGANENPPITANPGSGFRFDTARNASLAHVPEDADICFSVDLDERFHERGWCEAFKKAWEAVPGCNCLEYRFVMNQIEKDGKLVDDSVFEKDNAHSRRGWHWEYPVHNLLVPNEGTRPVAGRVPDRFSLYHHQTYKPDRADRINLHILNVEERPNAPRPLYYLGREYYYRHEWVKAIDMFDRYLEVVGENCWHDEKGNALYYQALCWEQIGNERFAELAALRAVAETAGREAFLFLVKLYYKKQKWFPAKYYAEAALRLKDNKAYFRDTSTFGPVFYDYLTMIYHHLGYRDQAAQAAKACLKMEPENERYQNNAAFFIKPEPKGLAVAYSITDNYAEHLAVSLYSLLKHNKVRVVYILIGSGKPVAEIDTLCARFGTRVIWLSLDAEFDKTFPPECPNRNSVYSDAALGRILLPRLAADEPKILYLDCDTIIRGPLDDFWNTDLTEKALAGCLKTDRPEALAWYTENLVPGGCPEYVNSGVLLMNLDMFRAEKFDAAAINLLNEKKYLMPDQDVLNIVCRGKINVLPNIFNSSESCGYAESPVIEHYACRRRWHEDTRCTGWQETKEKYNRSREGIAVVYSCTADWQDKLAVSLYSLLRHNKIRDLYLILGGGKVSPEIRSLVDRLGNGLNLHILPLEEIVDRRFSRECPNKNSYFSDAAFARLYLAEEINEDKVLYLDTDTVVHGNLSDLWQTDLSGCAAAGVIDDGAIRRHRNYLREIFGSGDFSGYVNSGVLLMNLALIRKTSATARLTNLVNYRRFHFADQDAVNLVFQGRIKHVGSEFNSSICCGFAADPVISHFAGHHRFWEDPDPDCQPWRDAVAEYKEFLNGRNE